MPPLPKISRTTWGIYKIQMAFDRPRKFYRWKHNFVDLVVTDDVTGQVKVKMVDELSNLVLSRVITVSNGKNQ